MKIKHLILGIVSLLSFCSCNEYNKVLKSGDVETKYEYAKMYYEQKKYPRAAVLLEDVVPYYRGTEQAEEAIYLLAMSYFEMGDYLSSAAITVCRHRLPSLRYDTYILYHIIMSKSRKKYNFKKIPSRHFADSENNYKFMRLRRCQETY